MPRVFVAIRLPADIAAALDRVLPELRGLRRVAPEQMHVTLAFVGQVGEEGVSPIVDAVTVASRSQGPFDVRITALGRFPDRGPARTIWAGTSPRSADGIVRLGASVRAELLRHSVGFDAKPLRAHVTLGRVRDGASEDAACAIAAAVSGASIGRGLAFRASSLHVMESRLSAEGPLYSSRGELPLTGPPGAITT